MAKGLHSCTGLSLGGIGKAEIRMGKLTCFCTAQAHAMYRGVEGLRGSICCGTGLKGFENLLPMRDAPSTPLATVKEPWLLSPFWCTAEATYTAFSTDHHGQS